MLTKVNNMNPNRFIYQKQVQSYKNYSEFANICGIFIIYRCLCHLFFALAGIQWGIVRCGI